MGNTPLRVFRVDDDLWQAAQRKALEKDVAVSDVLRAALRRFIRSR